MAHENDDFFVGWQDEMPPGLAGRVRSRVIGGAVVVVALALTIAAFQNPFAASAFEFGVTREFVGWVLEEPYPTLLVPAPGQKPGSHTVSRYTLAESGTKRGAQHLVAGRDAQMVRLRGTLIYREDKTMIDVEAGSVEALHEGGTEDAAPDWRAEDLGAATLTGEIVDSKCYYGVMNPATGKVHRACAARCISSGAPPVLLVRNRTGTDATLLLVDDEGRSVNRRVLDMVAEPVEITGLVMRHDNLLVLFADPEEYRRLQ